MRFIGACNNRIFPLSCIRNPVEPVIVQEATTNTPSSRPGSRNRNVREPHFSVMDKLRRFRDETRVQNIDENDNSLRSNTDSNKDNHDNDNHDNNNNHNSDNRDNNNHDSTEQRTSSEDENAHAQNRRRFKLLRKLLCMKVERERDLTIDYVKGRDENITMKEKLEQAEFLLRCEINKWTAEEEMSEREAITNEENVKILQSNYKYLVQRKALIQQELFKYQSYVEKLQTDLPEIFVNDGHYMQTPLERIEKYRAKYQARFKARVLPELEIVDIRHDEPLSEKGSTKGRLNLTPEPTCSGKEDPSKSVPKLTVVGEEPRLDDEQYDHNESVQAIWIQEPDTRKIPFKGHPNIDPSIRDEYDGDDESDGWNIPLLWLKEEEPGPSNVQRIRVKNESPHTDREKVRVLRSTSISLSSPTPTPEKGSEINGDAESHEEVQNKEIITKGSTESRPESCSSKTEDELKKDLEHTLVGFLTDLLANQEEDLAEEYYSEAEESDQEEEGPIYIGQIEDGINTPERQLKQVTLAAEHQACLSSPNKQTEEVPVEVYNTTSVVSSISSSIFDASVSAVNEANKRTITPRTVKAIKDLLENSAKIVLRTQSQEQIRRVAFDVERALSNRSCDALTLNEFITNTFGREEQYTSDFELDSDNESSPSLSGSDSSTPKHRKTPENEGINKEHPSRSEIRVSSSSSEDSITLVDIESLLGRKVGVTSDESDDESVTAESPSQRVITPNTLQSIRQNLQDGARVIRRTQSAQTIARAASNIKRSISTTSRNFFSKFRRQNAVGIMPSTDVVDTSQQ